MHVTDDARIALAQICEAHDDKLLQAEAVVVAAKPTQHVLHPYFTWDNRLAGHQWRVHEARKLIRTVAIVRDDTDMPATEHMVSLVQDRTKPSGGYRRETDIISSEALQQQLLESFQRELTSLLQRYGRYRVPALREMVLAHADLAEVELQNVEPLAALVS